MPPRSIMGRAWRWAPSGWRRSPAAGARADVLHVTYRVSLIGLPIGAVNLNADLSPTSYSIHGDAKLTGLARLLGNARGASTGAGRDRRRAMSRLRHSPPSPRIRT